MSGDLKLIWTRVVSVGQRIIALVRLKAVVQYRKGLLYTLFTSVEWMEHKALSSWY